MWRFIQRLLPIIYNNNLYHSVDNNCHSGSYNVLPYDGNLYGTTIPDNTGFIRNSTPNSK